MKLRDYITERSIPSYKLNQTQREELAQLLDEYIYQNPDKYFKTLNKKEKSVLEAIYDVLSDKYTYIKANLNLFDSNELDILYEFLSWIDRNDLWDDTTEVVDVLDFLENTLK